MLHRQLQKTYSEADENIMKYKNSKNEAAASRIFIC